MIIEIPLLLARNLHNQGKCVYFRNPHSGFSLIYESDRGPGSVSGDDSLIWGTIKHNLPQIIRIFYGLD
jgi:hypothetical protein